MKRGATILAAAALFSLGAVAVFLSGASAEADGGAMPAEVDIVAGQSLYQDHCAACHGENLEGQDNWKSPGADGRLPAPPHDETGHTWHHADQVLFTYTQLGGREMMAAQGMDFDSGMPGFGDQLTDQEIWDILAFIKSTWPARIQEVQAVRTESESRRREN